MISTTKTFTTKLTLIGFFSSVCSDMITIIFLWEKFFTTIFTPGKYQYCNIRSRIRLRSRDKQTRWLSEVWDRQTNKQIVLKSLESMVKSPVSFYLQMHTFSMIYQGRVCLKRSSTICTEEGFQFRVNWREVYSKCTFSSKLLATKMAMIWSDS